MAVGLKINISSLGCRLNQSEIQSVITMLRQRGHTITSGDDADVFIINSCKVTLHSERKTRNLLYKAKKSRNKNSKIILTGCCADSAEKVDDVFYIPNDYKHLIPDLIDGLIDMDDVTTAPPSRFLLPPPTDTTTTRTNLKIQDGCDSFCSYCIIPYARGGPQSKPAPAVFQEFKSLLDAGYREIVLTGVMIGSYRSDGFDLAGLVSSLLELPGEFRVHLASVSPAFVTPGLIELLGHEKIVRHLNLSLQSGSDSILTAMNRKYGSDDYRKIVDLIRTGDPDFNLTTDVIVGFPGEGENDFNETIEMIRFAEFSHIHTFRYSPRPGTAACDTGDDIPAAIKKERSERITGLYMKQKESYYKKFDGRISVLLTEKSPTGMARGFNEYYVPVEMDRAIERNRFVRVVTRFVPGEARLRGTLPGD